MCLIGAAESIATYKALEKIRPNQRPFVLTRSNFAGSGAYAAHWNGEHCKSSKILRKQSCFGLTCSVYTPGHCCVAGDNSATETDLYYSIPMMLSYQMFGIPMVGSDVCGFFRKLIHSNVHPIFICLYLQRTQLKSCVQDGCSWVHFIPSLEITTLKIWHLRLV